MARPSAASARVLAARILDAVLHRGRSLRAEFNDALPRLDDVRDRALVEAIVFAALRQRARYQAALDAWTGKPLGRKDNELRALLLAGFAQLDGLGLAEHAAVSETVEATRQLGRPHQAGLVNALLRRALREGLPDGDPAQAWPAWLARCIRADWPQHADAIFAESARAAPLWLRVNRRHGTLAEYQARLANAGIDARPHPLLADGLRVDAPLPVTALPGFAEGHVSVQDGSAQRVADALAPTAGMRVLDACAAPGGKTAHLLERHPDVTVIALDADARRVRRMTDTFARLGLPAQVRVGDGTQAKDWWNGHPYDRILIDAPCSATGIVRRQPDVLLHRREADISALRDTQARLLDALWPLLAPGGELVYATCSILRAENDQQVTAFLQRTTDARLLPLDAGFGHDTGHGHQRLPGEEGMDGFFIARLHKPAA
ncbi:MAG: 16S rRNA (cytosine(967)-C(5))-methyltransferase RsmB [Pseudoxanthomonas suwonensis]|nr:16S rRNA (cytosine(967)-C(5))-methyltransferase RsmB [Pseudoxanthomonas suwonensis]